MSRVFNSNIPAYVAVYDSLYSDILNNVYLEGEKLPSEVALSEKYGVSRNTLRQALAILCEDGLVIKSQGKGTVVAKRDESKFNGLIVNPITNMCRKEIDDIEINYNFAPPTDIGKNKLGLEKSDVVLACTNIYSCKKNNVAYSFTQVPVMFFKDMNVNSSDEESLENLVEKKIFDNAVKGNMSIKIINSNIEESKILHIKENSTLILLEVIYYNSDHEPFARCKFYLIPEYFNLKFQI